MLSRNCCSSETRLWIGLILFVLGAVILLQMLGYIPNETISYVFPAILVVVGLKFMISGGHKSQMDCMDCCGDCEMPTAPKAKKKATKKKK